jgi:tetratricopeptide (TPR) repeat protein
MTKGDNATAAKDSAGAVKHYNDAIEELKVARKLDPANAELMNAMIDLSIKTGRTAEAITLMEEGLAADPANRDYNYNIGVLYSGTGQTEKAISHFETALKTDPAHGPSLQNLGAAHFKKGDELKKAAQSDPTGNADKSVYVAEFKKAAGYFEQLTKIQPENGNVWEILGSAYANAGMIKEAQDAISKADSLRK